MNIKNNSKRVKAIIWDWNGTLLDDVDYSIDCINRLMLKRSMKPVTREQYQTVFTFPVKQYYEVIGFDFSHEPWEAVAMEFIRHYWEHMNDIPLFDDTVRVLQNNHNTGIRQFIISAMEHDRLNAMVNQRGLSGFFENVLGIHNHFAESKSHLGEQIMAEAHLGSDEIVWIGDTCHDYEVAQSLGIRTILITHGHQSRAVLSRVDATLCESLSEIALD